MWSLSSSVSSSGRAPAGQAEHPCAACLRVVRDGEPRLVSPRREDQHAERPPPPPHASSTNRKRRAALTAQPRGYGSAGRRVE